MLNKLTVVIIFFISLVASACPSLDGTFDCSESSGRRYQMEIHTHVEGAVSVYEIKTPGGRVTERSDNQIHHNDKANGKTDVNSKGYCEGDHFIYESEWNDPDLKPSGSTLVKFKKAMSLEKGALVVVSNYSNHDPIKMVCTKLP